LPQYADNEAVEQRNNLLAIQPKLTIGSPDDPYEREADSVANHVMRMPMNGGFWGNGGLGKAIQRKCSSCEQEEEEQIHRKPFNTVPNVQLKCAACENEEENIQRKPFNITPFIQKTGSDGGGLATDSVSNKIESSRGGGNSMSDNSRSFMESRFGLDFSGVIIHTDSNAINLSQELNAQAFTVGKDIYFNEGKYNPDSDSGRHLLAHELTHTVQQNGGFGKKNIQRVCSPSATCSAPISGSSSEFGASELSVEQSGRTRRRAMSATRATSTSHAGFARQLENFVNAQNPALLTNVRGIFVDQDLSPGTGALTQSCSSWEGIALPPGSRIPRTTGPDICIFVHGDLNQQALQFNITTNSTIGGLPREQWRIQTMQIFTHEVQHIVFDNAPHPQPAAISSATCDFVAVGHELSELNAILSEFPIIFRAIPAGTPITDPLFLELDRWFTRSATGGGEDFRGILTKMGCVCECDAVRHWVSHTFNFVSSSWSATEKTTFNTTMKAKLPAWPL
jgi:Domain of unknown function (DUF4157)